MVFSAEKAPSQNGFSITPVGPALAPDFVLKDQRGKTLSLKKLRGRVVVINFWASWCEACDDEMPSLEKLHKFFPDKDLVVIGINSSDSASKVARYKSGNRLSFATGLDTGGKVAAAYRVILLPATYILNRNGEAVGRAYGQRQWDSPEALKYFKELIEK